MKQLSNKWWRVAAAVLTITHGTLIFSPAQGIGIPYESVAKWHNGYAKQFRAGETNLPLLRMDWFTGCSVPPGGNEDICCARFSSVDKAGAVDGGFCCVSNSRGRSGVLDKGKLQLLADAMNALPSPPKASIPNTRKILVSGMRSNEWFQAIYDRANIPKQINAICELIKAPMEKAEATAVK